MTLSGAFFAKQNPGSPKLFQMSSLQTHFILIREDVFKTVMAFLNTQSRILSDAFRAAQKNKRQAPFTKIKYATILC